jgi:hypothetical protein
MGKKSGPPAPDYTAAAEKTAAGNQENLTQQTWANRANQTNPWGSETWSSAKTVDPATGKPVTQWTQNTTLDPRLQSALDSQIALQGGRSDLANSLMPRASQEFGQAMDWSGLTPWGTAAQAGRLGATTSAYGFGPRQERIDTSRQGTPQLQTSLDFGGVQDVAGSGQQRQRAEDAIYQSATSRLDPQWQQRQQSMESDLANRGISQNSEAYTRAMEDFNRQRTDAYQQAQMGAITGGGAEAQRNYGMDIGLRQQQVGEIGQQGAFTNQALGQGFGFGQQARQGQLSAQQAAYGQGLQGAQFGLGQQQQAFGQQQQAGAQNFQQQLQAAQFQNQQRQQQLTEAMQQRGFSLNEINAIISGQQVGTPQFAGYNQAGTVQGPDYSGAAQQQYGAAQQQFQNQQAGINGLLGAGAQIGSAAFMFSDRRVKRIVRRLGKHARGFGIYAFRYVGERGLRVGVIAQEVRRVAPELVRSVNGVLQVDYGRL